MLASFVVYASDGPERLRVLQCYVATMLFNSGIQTKGGWFRFVDLDISGTSSYG